MAGSVWPRVHCYLQKELQELAGSCCLSLAGKGILTLHLPGCGAQGRGRMRNGPIYNCKEPQGGHRVRKGLHQGQRPSPRR